MKPGSNISTTHTLYGPALWTVGHVLYLLMLSSSQASLKITTSGSLKHPLRSRFFWQTS